MLELVRDKIAALDLPSYVKDSELRYVAVNAAFARLHNLSVESFIHRHDREIFGIDPDGLRDDRERRVLVFGEEEALHLRPDPAGPVRVLHIERFFDDDDRIYLFGFMEEEEPFAASSAPSGSSPLPSVALFQAVLEQYPVATYVRDANHRLLFGNCAYAEMVGRPIAELIGGTEEENFPVLGRSYHEGNKRVLENGLREEIQETFITADGRRIPVLTRTGAVTGGDGARYIVGSITDLSPLRLEQHKLEVVRQESEALQMQLQSLMASLPVGIMVLDPDLTISFVNPAVVEMLEFETGGVLLGMPYRDFLVRAIGKARPDIPLHEVCERVDFRLEQIANLAEGPLIDIKTPSGRVLAGTSRRLAGGQILLTYSDVSEMFQREEETLLYRAALEQMPVPVFIRNPNHKMIYVNRAYEELHGQRREDVYGLTEEELWPEHGKIMKEENLRIFATGEMIEKNREIVVRDGREISVITRLSRITTSQNKHYLVGSVNDVSMIREGQEALMAAQARAETLYGDMVSMLQVMPVGVVILGADYVVEFANEKCREIWKWPPDLQLDGLPFRTYCEQNHARGWAWPGIEFEEGYRRRLAQFDALEGSHVTELAYDDGKFVLATITRLHDRKILLTYSDLTEMRAREREINEAQQQLERLGGFVQESMRMMTQGLMMIEKGRITEVNPSFTRILDLPETLVTTGESWRPIFEYCAARGDFGAEAQTILGQWQSALQGSNGVSTNFLANGKTWVKLEATFGGDRSCVVVLTDFTELKAREAELEVLLARAEAADKAKSDFLANMSHEIRTPMNGVLGMAELLSKSELDSRQKTFVDIMVKSGNALLTIINDILDFSKIDAGQLKLRKSPFDPVEAIEDVATLLSAAAAEKDIELVVSGDQKVMHTFMGDPGRFRQIVTNLVGNAIKFTEKGHVHVEVSAEPISEGQAVLKLRIEDTGIGIPPEMQAQIFEKFSQVDTSSTRRHEGTGLGLAITSGLVRLFGGKLSVESAVGCGSAFTVELPLPVVAERRRQRELPTTVKDARVLVIDDNAVNRRIISEQLKMWGFDGLAVSDGPSGLDILSAAHAEGLKIDVVVIDYQMPDMNGVDVARAIRDDRRFDDIALVFLTSMDMVGDDRLFESLKIQAHLMKPARANVLRGAIIDVVRTARVHGVNSARLKPFPATAPVQPPVLPQPPVVEPAVLHTETADQGALRVLIAEDNPVNQIVFRQILTGSGIAYRIVGNGEEAVQAWRSERPDLILMDVSMPVMNGHQATGLIRSEEAQRGNYRIPIIGVTAHALDSDREACLAAGMDDYLSKPISPELLMRKIEEWSGRPLAALASAER
ncbi:response regulator [Rhizobium sp. AQ_MP]|uniref:response regulator n=1 Tax=Rhizobium sp. AQ_MP TaxID=2761536 RepID=UPI00163AF681|nr:response regulator [Rhizobium sp. AQ_MP]MBC2774131.1 response regulator [Rhizobium sp. AQ_MP]